MDTSKTSRRRVRAFSQWDAIRAARAFYGRPLAYDELQKVKATYVEQSKHEAEEDLASRPAPRLLAPRATFIG